MSELKTRWILACGQYPEIYAIEPRWKDEISLSDELREDFSICKTELVGVYQNKYRSIIDSRICSSKFLNECNASPGLNKEYFDKICEYY